MPKRVLILGGYGNFGSFIARRLAADPALQLVIAGRSHAKAQAFAASLESVYPALAIEADIDGDLALVFAEAQPNIVIHCVGPFQGQDYRVALAAIAAGAHYVDLADARDMVAGIAHVDAEARAADRLAVSGASTVPCLTAAIVDEYRPHFARLRSLRYGITAAQRARPGLATSRAILSYVGRPFDLRRSGAPARVYGWQGLHAVRFPRLGKRLFGYCDIPDLALFPARYPELEHISFSAGHEVALVHRAAYALSWLVRLRLLSSLARFARRLHGIIGWFDPLGTDRGGLYMVMEGEGLDGQPKRVRYWLEAGSGNGPLVPCIPAIILARRLARGQITARGARPCLDLIDLASYHEELKGLDIEITVETTNA